MSAGTSKSSNKSAKRNRPTTPLITRVYAHMQANTGHNFSVSELSKELSASSTNIKRSLTRSVNRPDMYPDLFAYDDGSFAFNPTEPTKPKIKGNTQTETFAPPAAIETETLWEPGETMEVIGQLPSGEVVVLHNAMLHLVTIIEVGSIQKHMSL